jgi:glycerophosphoryl diester phosphodiesterase
MVLRDLEPGRLLNIAHRGVSRGGAENSLEGIRDSIARGIRAVELDIQGTLDGKALVFHGEKIKTLQGKRFRISDLTLAELRQLPLNASVPELREMLRELRTHNVALVADIKTRSIVQETVRALRDFGMLDRAFIVSFDPKTLRLTQGLCADLPTGLTIGFSRAARHPCGLFWAVLGFLFPVSEAILVGARMILVPAGRITEKIALRAKTRGLTVLVWGKVESLDIRWLQQIGVDGVISDLPDPAFGQLDRPGMASHGVSPRQSVDPTVR